MAVGSLVLVVNPGSASRKYALFADGDKLATINFEFEDKKVISKLEYGGQKYSNTHEDADLSAVSRYIWTIFKYYKIVSETDKLHAIGIRVVAPSKRFSKDEKATDEVLEALEAVQQRAPLHVKTVLAEIKQLKNHFTDIPIIIISDSSFHTTKPEWAWNYGIDTEIAEKFDIKRYGFHGISVGSVVRCLDEVNMSKSKMIICHLGSGSSISAVIDGKSVETTMGYTPLEGLMMATRVGNIDPSAVMAIKRGLQLEDDAVEEYLNKKCGLLGVSGTSDDIRQLLSSEENGDEKAKLALKMFIYRIQMAIGQMAASMGGVDQLVFTATVGERSAPIRERVLENLGYLGFINYKDTNDAVFEPKEPKNIGTPESKPIIVISTDEASEIARRAALYLNSK